MQQSSEARGKWGCKLLRRWLQSIAKSSGWVHLARVERSRGLNADYGGQPEKHSVSYDEKSECYVGKR